MGADGSPFSSSEERSDDVKNSKRRYSKPSVYPSNPDHRLPWKEPFHRPAARLPFELANHAHVYFDTKSYKEALCLLCRLLESATSISNPSQCRPAYVPPVQQIALVATLVVHPDTTTRATSSDLVEASNEALRYLRTLNKIVGPVNANLADIFSFDKRGLLPLDAGIDSDGSDTESNAMRITTKIANSGSLFAQADNFWHVLGWAFNCSVRNKRRWERWKHFLRLMLEVLEDDWGERRRLFNAKTENGEDEIAASEILCQSLICKYLRAIGAETSGGRRKMLRAIFANGEQKSLHEFGEVWRDETKESKRNEPGRLSDRGKMDVDMDNFGDYDRDEDDDIGLASARRSGRQLKRNIDEYELDPETDSEISAPNDSDPLGGVESLALRQRLLAFIAETTLTISNLGFTNRENLFNTYVEYVCPLPCPIFTLLLSTTRMSPDAERHLNTIMLTSFVATYPPQSVDLSNPSIKDFRTYFIPQAAKTNKATDNAKVSLLIEMLLRGFIRHRTEEVTAVKQLKQAAQRGKLREAVEKGIKARRERLTGDLRKKNKGMAGEEFEAKTLLGNSAERLMILVQMME